MVVKLHKHTNTPRLFVSPKEVRTVLSFWARAILTARADPVKVASIKKENKTKDNPTNLILPSWLFDCVKQAERDVGRMSLLLPYEPKHVLEVTAEDKATFDRSIDPYGDSYARDSTVEELEQLLEAMANTKDVLDADEILADLAGNEDMVDTPGWMFKGVRAYLARDHHGHESDAMEIDGQEAKADLILDSAGRTMLFAGGDIVQTLEEDSLTHVIIGQDRSGLKALRRKLATYVSFIYVRAHSTADSYQIHQATKDCHNRLGHKQLERGN